MEYCIIFLIPMILFMGYMWMNLSLVRSDIEFFKSSLYMKSHSKVLKCIIKEAIQEVYEENSNRHKGL